MSQTDIDKPTNFIRQIVARDLAERKHTGVVTRFPPEPNGYLHIGHAKSICLNFGVAEEFAGRCHLRFDDTNPDKENLEYIESIKDTVRWLGFEWGDHLHHASDYFEQLYGYAVDLIRLGKAYVCQLNAEELRTYRGTLTEPGTESPWRNRPVEENLDLFARMRAGEFEEGQCVLRAKIDMAAPNLNLRDPTLYRIKKSRHPMTGDAWCIYPMYDFTHCLSDAIEGVTHSLCTLEFEDHRPLYDWFLDQLDTPCHPRQIEFARLNLDYTVLSKRKLHQLVDEGHVTGWDDPRMPTLAGMRRRGYTPEAIRDFCRRIGVTRKDAVIETSVLENCQREALDPVAVRYMAVLEPLKLVIENYPAGEEFISASNHPQNPEMGERAVPFCRELYIEATDFMAEPSRKFHRLAPGREVRLRYAYLVTCTDVVRDTDGIIREVRCRYDPESRGGSAPDGRKVKGTIHWVSARHGVPARVMLYDRLFNTPAPDASGQFLQALNPESEKVLHHSVVEPALASLDPEARVQFERHGYFRIDPISSNKELTVFNRVVSLRDSWGKVQRGG